MKRQMSWALLAGGAALTAATATAVPAAAATSGSQTFKGAIVTSGVSGTPTVITTVVIAKGTFSGIGRIVGVENQPGDDDRVTRNDLVFARGSMHLKSRALGEPQPSVNPRSCVATITIHQTGKVVGGTRQFTAAKGSFTATVTARAVLARNPDGSCSLEQAPLYEVNLITATGRLSF